MNDIVLPFIMGYGPTGRVIGVLCFNFLSTNVNICDRIMTQSLVEYCKKVVVPYICVF